MKEDKYLRITSAQFEIWIDNPVTLAYLQCLNWSKEQISEAMGMGGFIDSSNSDITMSQVHVAMGKKEGLEKAARPFDMLKTHEMIDKGVEE